MRKVILESQDVVVHVDDIPRDKPIFLSFRNMIVGIVVVNDNDCYAQFANGSQSSIYGTIRALIEDNEDVYEFVTE